MGPFLGPPPSAFAEVLFALFVGVCRVRRDLLVMRHFPSSELALSELALRLDSCS